MPQREKLDRTAFTKGAAFMVRATPLVAVVYIKFFPSSYYFEPPVQLPLRGPEATFRLSLPEELKRVYEDSTVIRSLQRTELGWRVGDQPIACARDRDEAVASLLFHLGGSIALAHTLLRRHHRLGKTRNIDEVEFQAFR
jgi:hypothetical protein